MATSKKDGGHELLRHPLIVVLVSFVLSGIIAGSFTHWLSSSQSEREQRRLLMQNRKAAVQRLSTFVYERRARAEMLASSFRRAAPIEEVKERKRLYDDAYVKWNANHQANLFLVRDVLEEKDYSYFESVVEFTLVGKVFAPLDACLTRAYDAAIKGDDPVALIDDCDARRLLQEALDCGYAVSNELYRLSGSVGTRADAEAEIKRRCPL